MGQSASVRLGPLTDADAEFDDVTAVVRDNAAVRELTHAVFARMPIAKNTAALKRNHILYSA
jgi:hypothetical protein